MSSSEFSINKKPAFGNLFRWKYSYFPVTAIVLLLFVHPISFALTCITVLAIFEWIRFPKRITFYQKEIFIHYWFTQKRINYSFVLIEALKNNRMYQLQFAKPSFSIVLELTETEFSQINSAIKMPRKSSV